MASHWLRFEWDLSGVPQNADEIPSPLVVRDATKEEEASVLKVIASSFSMDTGWADIHKPLLARLTGEIEKAFEDKETPSCIVLQYGNRIIGCSVLNLDETAENHLVTGPCVLHEYRSRSMGSGLLGPRSCASARRVCARPTASRASRRSPRASSIRNSPASPPSG